MRTRALSCECAGGQLAGATWVVKSSSPWLSMTTAVMETCWSAGTVVVAWVPVRTSSLPSAWWMYQSTFVIVPSASETGRAGQGVARPSGRASCLAFVRQRVRPREHKTENPSLYQ